MQALVKSLVNIMLEQDDKNKKKEVEFLQQLFGKFKRFRHLVIKALLDRDELIPKQKSGDNASQPPQELSTKEKLLQRT